MRDIVRTSMAASHTSPQAVKAYEECMMHFNIFHVLNNIMYQEFLKTSDIIEEQHLDRFLVKRSLKRCYALYQKYTDYMDKYLPKDRWYLDQDYARIAYEGVEPRLTHLYVAAYNLLSKKGIGRVQVLGHSICVVFMLEIIASTWQTFFVTYKALSGMDFSSEFSYAGMAEFQREYVTMHNELFKVSRESVSLSDDPACCAAMRALRNHIDNEDFFDQAALRALKLNPKVYAEYEKDIEKINKEKEEREDKEMSEEIAVTLSQKFNVKRRKA